ncbi:non-canonical purine NTP pyrophosphatase [Conexibacter stalactiti]|uniref:dITP/XTP pyrophosphatase n=1 Tax=Conexibacter stalactiti TaxID=1940611 RepID=A0ABU4HMM6_9ACTN|nr:non-canonical purine NTP pyrophosphatase [Conexibacter stalactiti]MDW5593969.1 non-canonical purine NTP pyrophosphatase [Conexibacter stalactiti]MEC5034611.1 non-canonical purine NTP pyrophosphatase [Conexibacter stalactiti]
MSADEPERVAAGEPAAAAGGAPLRLILSTRNDHKLREFARLTGGRLAVDPLPDEVVLPPEDGSTFAENALGKARAAAEATGRAAIADDSGIEAEALGGRPGIYSARYAGPDASDGENLAKLLREAPAGSALAYVCAIAYVDPVGGGEHVVEGRCTGTLAAQPSGAGGFGYDPAFVPDDELPGGAPGRTMAELGDAEKDSISHRGRALRALVEWLDR